MSEGTENAEAQKPSKYKGFGQKVWRVRSQSSETCSAVQQAIIHERTIEHSKPLKALCFQGFSYFNRTQNYCEFVRIFIGNQHTANIQPAR